MDTLSSRVLPLAVFDARMRGTHGSDLISDACPTSLPPLMAGQVAEGLQLGSPRRHPCPHIR